MTTRFPLVLASFFLLLALLPAAAEEVPPALRVEIDGGGVSIRIGAMASGSPAAPLASSDSSGLSVVGGGKPVGADCAGQPASITASKARIHLTGACRGLTLTGSDNIVTIDFASQPLVSITGSNNLLQYTTVDGSEPRLAATGSDNLLRRR